MRGPILAYIIPLTGGGPVDPGYGVPGWPTHPIAPGGPGRPVDPSFGVPGWPAHPIAPGGPGGKPPGIWGGGNEPFPTPPIVLPPGTVKPPPGIWHEIVFPSHPIAPGGQPTHPIAPGGPPLQIWGDPIIPAEPPQIIDWHAGWSEETGWVLVGVPNVPAPTPSK